MKAIINVTDKNIQNDIKSLISPNLDGNGFDITINDDRIGYMKMSNKPMSGFSIYYSEARIMEDLKVINNFQDTRYFAMHFQLKGSVQYKMNHLDINNSESGFNNIWGLCNNNEGYFKTQKGKLYSSINIVFNDEYLKNIVERYPGLLDEYYIKYCNGESFYLRKGNIFTTREMNLILAQLQNMDLMGSTREIYAESKVLELLALQFNLLDDIIKNDLKSVSRRKYNVDKIHEARFLLLSNLNNPPTIDDLSRETGLNKKKLQLGFKEVFNQTIYGCLFDHKMELARQLLLETDKTIFEVALECGYDYVSHFTTAFKKRFGITPGVFRK